MMKVEMTVVMKVEKENTMMRKMKKLKFTIKKRKNMKKMMVEMTID